LNNQNLLGPIVGKYLNTEGRSNQVNKKISHIGVDCDNNGVVTHDNDLCNPLLTNKTQADLLQVFKNLVANQPFAVKYKYVKAHADDTRKWCDCMLNEWIYIKVDGLAKKSLKGAMITGKLLTASSQTSWYGYRWVGRKCQHPQDWD
jgi:hypothetical protein